MKQSLNHLAVLLIFLVLSLSFPLICGAETGEADTDTDGDGICDEEEVAQGYNPHVVTRIIYVDGSKLDDTGDGLTPEAAKRTIKGGVNTAKAADVENVVLVAPGTYSGPDNREIEFGGYNIKLRSRQGATLTIVDLQKQGIFLHVKNHENKSDAWLEGFTIKNGRGSYYGGAVEVNNSSGLLVKNCVFRDNETGGCGGALYSSGSNTDVEYSKFFNNRYKNDGSYGSSPEVGGGAIFASGGTCNVKNSEFLNNSAIGGGAINVSSSGTLNLDSCILRNNNATYGGSLYMSYSTTVSMVNCLVLNNKADYYGFMHLASESNLTIRHSTVFGNTSRNSADLLIAGTLNLYNSIFRGSYSGTPVTISNSCMSQDSSAYGNGNIAADPMLTPLGLLKTGSPCIDAGNSDYGLSKDLSGQTRPVGNAPDMGCYEFLDSDGDGIPDNVEIAAGMNPNDSSDASGDIDNDGLKNHNEFLMGLDPGNSDSDQDGIGDSVEITLGYDPALYTQVIYVDPTKNDDTGDGLTQENAKKTIRAALSLSSKGMDNVIMLLPGIYSGVENRNLSLDQINIKIKGVQGATATIIDMENSSRFLALSNGEKSSLIEGITVKNGNADYGSGIRLDNMNMEVRDCIFDSNYASQYGALYSSGRSVKIVNCQFRNNEASSGGGLTLAGTGETTIETTTFFFNYARTDGGALQLREGASAKITASRFINNLAKSEGGAVFVTGSGNLKLINTLLNRNRAFGLYSDIKGDNASQQYTLMNVTIANSKTSRNSVCRFEGSAIITNSIINGKISNSPDRPLSANYNCSPMDWSGFGTGNIMLDPQLTLGGYLRAGSPCINSGISENAPQKDLDGTIRPSGNAIDIGCHEFIDTDGDGIPDIVETLSGLNPNNSSDALQDKDGDGLSNLLEYYNGTDSNNSDTDGDGINDKAEIDAGYDPFIKTRFIYVDHAKADDSGDGLSQNTAKKTITGGVNAAKTIYDNIVLVKPGVYVGGSNRGITFSGYNIKLCTLRIAVGS